MITSDSPLADHAVREAVMRGRFKLLLMTAVGQNLPVVTVAVEPGFPASLVM